MTRGIERRQKPGWQKLRRTFPPPPKQAPPDLRKRGPSKEKEKAKDGR